MNMSRHSWLPITSVLFVILVSLLTVFVPPPKPAKAQLSGQQTWLGTAGGTANALSFAIHNIASLNDLLGVQLRFLPASANTNAVTITITLDGGGSLGPVSLQRPTSNIGLQAFSGAELQTGQSAQVMYNGSVFEFTSPIDMTAIGRSVEVRGSAAPKGTLIEDGSCYSETQYAALFSVIGTSYNAQAPVACGTGTFAVPDSRGTMFAAEDNQGVNGAAGRITSAGSGCTATAIGLCGAQNHTLSLAEIPAHSHGVFLNDPGHSHTPQIGGSTNVFAAIQPGTTYNLGLGSSGYTVSNLAINSNTTGITVWSQSGATGTQNSTNSQGGGGAHTILNPISLGLRAIKY